MNEKSTDKKLDRDHPTCHSWVEDGDRVPVVLGGDLIFVLVVLVNLQTVLLSPDVVESSAVHEVPFPPLLLLREFGGEGHLVNLPLLNVLLYGMFQPLSFLYNHLLLWLLALHQHGPEVHAALDCGETGREKKRAF